MSALPADEASKSCGCEYLVDAYECRGDRLRSRDCLGRIVDALIADLDLHPIVDPVWHAFPGAGGVTALVLLRESHIALHTFPERGFATFNLYCCRPRQEWPWEDRLASALGAVHVVVRRSERGAAVRSVEAAGR